MRGEIHGFEEVFSEFLGGAMVGGFQELAASPVRGSPVIRDFIDMQPDPLPIGGHIHIPSFATPMKGT